MLSFIESSLPGYYHAAASTLEPIDRVQRRLLRELDLPELDALRFHKLAPLPSRRDMGMLGALHKLTLGTAPPQLANLLPCKGHVLEPASRQRLRGWRPLHTKQLETPAHFRSSDLMKRSLFCLALTYNQLPQLAVRQVP